MCQPKKLKITSKFLNKHSVDGPPMVKFSSKSLPVDIVDICSHPQQVPKSYTVASPVLNKRKICNDKLNLCDKNIQNTKLFKTSVAELISKEKVFSPFYNESSKELFQKLSFPQMTDLSDLISSSLSGFSNNSDVNSFVLTKPISNPPNKNSQKIYSQLLQYLPQDIMAAENTRVVRKIRIFPSTEQKELLSKCFGATRFLYNRTLDLIKSAYKNASKRLRKTAKKGCIKMIISKSTKKSGSKTSKKITKQCCNELKTKYFCSKHYKSKVNWDVPLNFQYWRNKVILKKSEIPETESWLNEIPFDTRQLVIKNVLANYKSCISNLKNKHIKQFDIRFKSKHDKNQFCLIDYRALNDKMHLWTSKFKYELNMRKGEKRWLKKYLKTHQRKKFKEAKQERKKERSDMIITREYPGIYYLHIPYIKPKIKTKAKFDAIAIDPGVRTFHSFYSMNGSYGKIGDHLAERILEIDKKIDKIKSKITQTINKVNGGGYVLNKRRRQNMRKKCARLRTKIRNIINDFHWKTASYYCKNYQTIIIPKMNKERLIKKIKQQFKYSMQGDQIRKLMCLAHNKCVDRIKFKAIQYGRHVIIQNESYTSMTCGNCGILHKNLGGSKIYQCKNCLKIIDRDINGARNIMIKGLIN
jgi:IS605 OrfB family transposase